MITSKKLETINGKTIVIHGWDIKKLSFALFIEVIIITLEMFSESQLYPSKKQKLKRKTPGEQHNFPAHRLDARFGLNLEACVFLGASWVWEQTDPNNNYY